MTEQEQVKQIVGKYNKAFRIYQTMQAQKNLKPS